VPAAQQPVVEAEHWDHARGGVDGGAQRRVIVDAEIAPEPDERGHADRGSS
jgi:hypothetical protein